MFQVRSTERAYWRLTSLDAFDGEIWSSSGEFKQADEDLPSDSPGRRRRRSRSPSGSDRGARSDLGARPRSRRVSLRATETPLRWDPDSSTLIVEVVARPPPTG